MPPTSARQAAVATRRNERVYGALAGVYDRFFDWALAPGRIRAVRQAAAVAAPRVLEIGVGTGLSLPHYPPGAKVTGIDVSRQMLELARRRSEALGRRDVELIRMDARSLSFADGSFDAVLAPYVMSVVPEPERVMGQMARVCRPGGTVVVVNHFGSSLPGLHWLERRVTPLSQWLGFRLDLQLERLTATEGLELERVERVNLLGLWKLVRFRRS